MGYEISDGRPLSAIYAALQPGMTPRANVGYEDNGADLASKFAPISYGARSPTNSGYTINTGQDLSELFAGAGTVVTNIPFSGADYIATAQGGTGSTGLLQATTTFRLNTDGTFVATASDTFSGGRTLQQGNVYPYGAPAEWEYRVVGTNGTNYDSGWRNATTALVRQVSAERPANAPGEFEIREWYQFQCRRAGTTNVSGAANFSIMAGVYSWI